MQSRPDAPARGYRPLTGVSLAQLGGGFAGGANAAYIVVLAAHLGVSPGSLGWIASSFGFALLGVAVVGRHLLRLGAERLLRIAAALGVASAVVLALMPGYPLIVPAALAGGLSGAAMLLSSATLLRGEASRMSLITGFASLASLVAPPAVGIVTLAGLPGGWALVLPVPFLMLVALRGVSRPSGLPVPEQAATTRPDPVPVPGRPRPVAVAAAWSAIVLAVAAEFCFFTWGVARLVDSGLGIGPAAVAGVAFPLGMVVGRFLGARLPAAGAPILRFRLRLAAGVTDLRTAFLLPLPLLALLVVAVHPRWTRTPAPAPMSRRPAPVPA